jgi:membrane-bound ClpP family serine protease
MIRKPLIFSIVTLLLTILAVPSFAQETIPQPRIVVLSIDNYIINPVISKFIISAIEEAQGSHAACVIIQLDTPAAFLNRPAI